MQQYFFLFFLTLTIINPPESNKKTAAQVLQSTFVCPRLEGALLSTRGSSLTYRVLTVSAFASISLLMTDTLILKVEHFSFLVAILLFQPKLVVCNEIDQHITLR